MAMYATCPQCESEVWVNDMSPKGCSGGTPGISDIKVTCPNEKCGHSFIPPILYLETKAIGVKVGGPA
jgi:hypothetical protein